MATADTTTLRQPRLAVSQTEAAELYGKPGAGENTLDYWAGYAPNPDDAARLGPQGLQMGAVELRHREQFAGRARPRKTTRMMCARSTA